jgi:rhodanese-related sulfurtransferase
MRKVLLLILVIAVSLSLTVPCLAAKDDFRVDKETLKSWLADPGVLILDVRTGSSWDKSAAKIKGALRQDPHKVKDWAASLPKDKKIVLYCS